MSRSSTVVLHEMRIRSATAARLLEGAKARHVRHQQDEMADDTIVLSSFPKSGSTWLRFLLATAITGAPQTFDTIAGVIPPMPGEGSGQGPQLVKTHEHAGRFPAPRRVVCLVREPADVARSYFDHLRMVGLSVPTMTRFTRLFADGRIGSYGSWTDHAAAAAELAGSGRGLIIRYEDLSRKPVSVLDSIIEWIDVDAAGTPAAAVHSCSREYMSKLEKESVLLAQRRRASIGFVSTTVGERTTMSDEDRRALNTALSTGRQLLGYPTSE